MFFAVALATVAFVSCKNGERTSSENTSSDVDSLAYNLGLAQSGGLKQYMTMQLGVDSLHIEDFIKGMKAAASNSDSSQIAYNKGLQVGADVINMAKGLSQQVYGPDSTAKATIGTEKILEGLIEGLRMADGPDKQKLLEDANNSFNTKLEELHKKLMLEQYGEWKTKNEKFLDDNKKKEGVTTLPSGVQYKVIEAGSGSAMNADSIVTCDYVGKLIDGTEFDSSEKPGRDPIQVNLKQPSVIPGWVDVLKIMPKNAVWEVYIPADQGYGEREMGEIKPFSTLVFTIKTNPAPRPKETPKATPTPVPVKPAK